jgi:hypothetical protein
MYNRNLFHYSLRSERRVRLCPNPLGIAKASEQNEI